MATNLPSSIPSTSVSIKDDDETKPRPSPPQPSSQMRSNIHPLQRISRDDSIAFPSSSGEESFSGIEGSKDARGNNIVLELCSCFFVCLLFFLCSNDLYLHTLVSSLSNLAKIVYLKMTSDGLWNTYGYYFYFS